MAEPKLKNGSVIDSKHCSGRRAVIISDPTYGPEGEAHSYEALCGCKVKYLQLGALWAEKNGVEPEDSARSAAASE